MCQLPVSSVSKEELWEFPLRYLLGGLPGGGTRLSRMGGLASLLHFEVEPGLRLGLPAI